MLNAANQRGCSIFPQMQGIEFANSVNVASHVTSYYWRSGTIPKHYIEKFCGVCKGL
jgi:hypothetical protein